MLLATSILIPRQLAPVRIGGSNLEIGLYITNITNNLYRVPNSDVFPSVLYTATLY